MIDILACSPGFFTGIWTKLSRTKRNEKSERYRQRPRWDCLKWVLSSPSHVQRPQRCGSRTGLNMGLRVFGLHNVHPRESGLCTIPYDRITHPVFFLPAVSFYLYTQNLTLRMLHLISGLPQPPSRRASSALKGTKMRLCSLLYSRFHFRFCTGDLIL